MALDTGNFDFTRNIALPPARLWEVLTDARHREQWGAPGEGVVLIVEHFDLREGGADRHRCGPADAPEFVVDTRWYRLDAPQRAVFTETLVIGGDLVATSLVTYVLEQVGKGTRLLVNVAVSSFTGPETAVEFRGGWEGGLANLDTYVARLSTEAAT